ncbi:putative DNA binding domain-containing protein [Chryseobacterium sp. JJR-5R]|uniref:RNA-binding domain-containing protein n=1 Tax=Chryseobacterium sp. JJR-5R TaxID=3093923 RepID=UPI002A75925A|nr:RNA-binding domain-containing protein [Chryseobacterium sp. JJR-5R]WPO84229.1 putative DNA binding domain-containing protein [Chryseobacterium sp. JJR-5R]
MNLHLLNEEVSSIISDIKNQGLFKKENDLIDYKKELNHFGLTDETEIFFRNFGKDIISFTNNNGGIILVGFTEDETTGEISDSGLAQKDLEIFTKIDLNKVHQKLDSITKCNFGLDLQQFQISSRKFYYLLIEKNNDITIPLNDFSDYKLKKGEIIHRISGKNETANENSQKINRFLQIKANEKSKEFMEIWSKLLPEIFDINPKEILMINPKTNMIYGYNQKDKNLSGSEIDVDKSEAGAFNIILNAISAGDIGKISNDEGKPLYKIVGELKSKTPRDFIYFSSLFDKIKILSSYNLSSNQLKCVFKYLNWINDEKLPIENPDKTKINNVFNQFIWVETLDKTYKIVFSEDAIDPIVEAINDSKKHIAIFGKTLQNKKSKLNTMPKLFATAKN